MTKSFISVCIFFSIFSSAELLLEITQGSDNPINLGIYEISNQEKEYSLIKNIIQNDLIDSAACILVEPLSHSSYNPVTESPHSSIIFI